MFYPNSKKLRKTSSGVFLVSFSLMGIFAVACGKSSTGVNPGGDTPKPGISNVLMVSLKKPAYNPCLSDVCIQSDLNHPTGTAEIELTLDFGSVESKTIQFQVLNSQQNKLDPSEWQISCPSGEVTPQNKMTCQVVFSPKTKITEAGSAQVVYSYVNNLGVKSLGLKSFDVSYMGTSLLGGFTSFKVPSSVMNLEQINQIKMNQEGTPYIGLLGTQIYNFSTEKGIIDPVSAFEETSNPNYFIVHSSHYQTAPFLMDASTGHSLSVSAITGDDRAYSVAKGSQFIYACSVSGSIYSFSPDANFKSSVKFSRNIPVGLSFAPQCDVEKSTSKNEIVYSVSNDKAGAGYICGSTPEDTACFLSAVTTAGGNPSIYAANGMVYLKYDELGAQYSQHLKAYQYQSNSGFAELNLVSSFHEISMPDLAVQSMKWNSHNGLMYAVVQSQNTGTYDLISFSANNGGNVTTMMSFGLNDNGTPETISKPQITSQGSVVVVTSKGFIYAWDKDGHGVFRDEKPYAGIVTTKNITLPLNTNSVDYVSQSNSLSIPIKVSSDFFVTNVPLTW